MQTRTMESSRSSNGSGTNNTILDGILSTLVPDMPPDTTPPQHLDNSSSSSSASGGERVDVYSLSSTALWVYFSFRILWAFMAIFGNTLTIVVVIKYKVLQMTNNIYICSLAVADLLAAIILPLMIVHEVYSTSPFYTAVCLTERFLSLLSTAGNMLSILYIAINNYIYFAFPLRYKTLITPTKTFIVLGVTWLTLVSEILILFLLRSHVEVGIKCNSGIFTDPNVFYILGVHFYIIPAITVGFYIAIAKIAWKQGVAVAALQQPYDTIEASTSRSSKRICKMLGLVLGLYFLSLAPTYILSTVLHTGKVSKALVAGEKVTALIFWANTWVNPLIYTWRLKQFRIAFSKFLLGRGSFEEFVP